MNRVDQWRSPNRRQGCRYFHGSRSRSLRELAAHRPHGSEDRRAQSEQQWPARFLVRESQKKTHLHQLRKSENYLRFFVRQALSTPIEDSAKAVMSRSTVGWGG